jgi:outer membrane usher protein
LGLVQDSFEAGWLRENYGQSSDDYSDPFATGTYRLGISNTVTMEGRGELQNDITTLGASVATLLPSISSVMEVAFAASHTRDGYPAGMARASYSYQGRRWSASALLQKTDARFRQLGSNPAHLPRESVNFQISLPVGAGALSMNYLRLLNQNENETRIVNLNYSHHLGDSAFIAASLIRPLSPDVGTTLGIVLTLVFDQRDVASASWSAQPHGESLYTEFQRSTPRNAGTGYRLAQFNGNADGARQEASLTHNQSLGRFQADVIRHHETVSTRLGLNGGIGLLGGELVAARGLEAGFAVVQVGEAPGIPIYLENQIAAHTNRRGRAVVSPLRAYEDNHIRLDSLSLTMDTTLPEFQKTVVPRPQGGVIVDFKARTVRNATLIVVGPGGNVLPPWTAVEVLSTDQAFVVGNRGTVFVELPQILHNRVIARPANQAACEFSLDLPEETIASPQLGPFTCLIPD